ncbi:phytanoyl-CoA dioxygenase family protein [Cytophagaceae bacterium DM2B3-1]|uniref:Phytanoyl-CoA dioxygenase family protein n=1 Tax=Xanthocytophaga flava TaxID=3048013 RepID=A0ABT7CGD1_9BACT|nr:phytanoyl-CoA dioxygenase family protein [Xanthocytophaga flavus]MDJ1491769.1 phytanoyl-CoA dioxygenase family protein [Xanthocytophaga flavus]
MHAFLAQVSTYKEKLINDGFLVIEDIYQPQEVEQLINYLETSTGEGPNFRKTDDLFAIRNFLHEVPHVNSLLWTDNLHQVIEQLFGPDYFCIKSIFFDKPPLSNWMVAWHQDLMISVDKRKEIAGFGPWINKHEAFNVQPPVQMLENIYTIRLHLDDCDETNGALKVIAGSHTTGVLSSEQLLHQTKKQKEDVCCVKKGGIMIMKPLLLHSSSKSTSSRNRRVIHLEFANQQLPDDLNWKEYINQQNNYSTVL